MNCPYCFNKMEEGYIPTDRYSLKWISNTEKSKIPFFHKSIKLNRVLEGPPDAFYCSTCKKIIINIEK